MSSPMLFMDESGFAGEDLFNSDQPVFVLATVFLTRGRVPNHKTGTLWRRSCSRTKAQQAVQAHSLYPASQTAERQP